MTDTGYAPFSTRYAPTAMVSTIDHLATEAGLGAIRDGGGAVDAAIAANAVLAVTAPNLCGMGGDLFALVSLGATPVAALNASGRAGSGADAERLRGEGSREMPFRHDIRSVTVPGCVDGWVALHDRFGRLPLAQLLAPAAGYARDGFPASPLLATTVAALPKAPETAELRGATGRRRTGDIVRRPGLARALDAISAQGRRGFYEGEFGEGLLALGAGEYDTADLATSGADWVDPISVPAFGHRLWTMPPNSQGYLLAASAWIADGLDLPDAPEDPLWAHLLVEASKQAGFDRPQVLHEHADGHALVAPSRLEARRRAIDSEHASALAGPVSTGDTTALCVIDGDGVAVSLIQSNASGFGSHLFEPQTGINLHNRGLGFSLEPGHPAEYGPGRRPPHTLTPALVTDDDGHVVAALGTMGGDSQPQVLLQILARVFVGSESPGRAISAGRFRLVARAHDRLRDLDRPRGHRGRDRGARTRSVARRPRRAGTRGRAGTAVRPRVRPRPPHRPRGWPPRGCRRPAPSDRTLLRHLSAGYRRVTVTAATCPKDMTYGPCGGVSADGACEVGPFACVFLDRDVVSWKETARHAAPPVEDALVVASRSRPLVVADLADRPLDAGSTRTAVAQLTSSVDAVLFGDTGWARVQLSPAYRASVIAAEGMRPWAGLNCRDRNRVALEGELAALADVGAAVHCVTGDHTAIGHRPEARAVFDLDSTELASLAARRGCSSQSPKTPSRLRSTPVPPASPRR